MISVMFSPRTLFSSSRTSPQWQTDALISLGLMLTFLAWEGQHGLGHSHPHQSI